MRRTICLVVTVILAACSQKPPPAPVADDVTHRTIAQGDIVGFVTEDGAHGWRAVPYASPPEGDLRWRAPRPPENWEGAREATMFADRCMQLSNRLNAGEGIKPGKVIGSEDCLYLDIYAPPDAQSKNLPVMVWIHGGANVWGRSSNYEGSRLAVNEDVIVVAVQYRVGPLGFFSHELLRDTAKAPEDTAANFATLDLVASLKWVRENIAAFGGDPELVTIFGESAGGANVATLMASPLAKGLFHRAIIQSGTFSSVSLEDAKSGHRNASNKIVERVGAANAEELRAVDPEKLFTAYMDGDFAFLDMPTIIEDGVSLPPYPLRDAFSSLDSFNVVPVITGTNRDEMKFFYFGDPRFVKRKFFLFPAPRDAEFYDRLNHYMARLWRILSVDMPAADMTKAGHEAVYAYRFDWDESGKFVLSDFSELVGAGHAVEIPFVFNRFEFFGARYDKTFFEEETAQTRRDLSRAMGAYWANFARHGEPEAAGAPAWPAWPRDGAALLLLDSASDGGVAVMNTADSIDQLSANLRADDALNDGERCTIVGEFAMWQAEFTDHLATEFGCAVEN